MSSLQTENERNTAALEELRTEYKSAKEQIAALRADKTQQENQIFEQEQIIASQREGKLNVGVHRCCFTVRFRSI